MLKVEPPSFMIAHTPFSFYILLNNVIIKPVSYLDTGMYVDPITHQTFENANQIPCENNTQTVFAIGPDANHYYVSTPQPIKMTFLILLDLLKVKLLLALTPLLLKLKVFFSNEFKHFWKCVLSTKHSDNTFQLLGKAFSYDITSKQSSELLPDNPYQSLRNSLHDLMLNLAPFFNPDWFANALIKLFGYPGYILTQCGFYLSTGLFLQFAFNSIICFTVLLLLKDFLKNKHSYFCLR